MTKKMNQDNPINSVGEYAVGRLQINDGDTLLLQMGNSWTSEQRAYYARTVEDWALQRGKRWDVLPIPEGISITVIPAATSVPTPPARREGGDLRPGWFRKRPVAVRAVRVLGNHPIDDYAQWCGGGAKNNYVIIPTSEGSMRASCGDWIIRGVAGEFYPCKDEIFRATYESIPTPHMGGSDD